MEICSTKMPILKRSKNQTKRSCSVVSDSLPQPIRLLHPWNFLGKSTGVGCHFLLQGIFPTWGSNPGSPALWADTLLSEPPGNPPRYTYGNIYICLTKIFTRILREATILIVQYQKLPRYSSTVKWVKYIPLHLYKRTVSAMRMNYQYVQQYRWFSQI